MRLTQNQFSILRVLAMAGAATPRLLREGVDYIDKSALTDLELAEALEGLRAARLVRRRGNKWALSAPMARLVPLTPKRFIRMLARHWVEPLAGLGVELPD
jgi:hypothetical protein